MLKQHWFRRLLVSPPVRVGISLLAICVCLFVIWICVQLTLSSVLSRFSLITANPTTAEQAANLTPRDPSAHQTRAAVLYHLGDLAEAARELEREVSLKPRDPFAWLELGIVRDQLEDQAQTLAAFDEAVRLAPYYSVPRWQRGNVLLRAGRYDEAFADLRHAAHSNPELVPNVIDLAWGVSGGDIKLTENWAEINTQTTRVVFARLLAGQGKLSEATQKFKEAGPVSGEIRREFAKQLIALEAFPEAFEIWREGDGNKSDGGMITSVYDGGFEAPLSLDEEGFGWRVPRTPQNVKLSQDSSQRQSGGQSLLLEFFGDSRPDTPLISQYIVVEPSKRYRVYFAARTQDIVTGGLPLVAVSDAAGAHSGLGQSAVLRTGTNDWQSLSFDFVTGAATRAITLSLQRMNCTTSPCPAFGSVWLDSFSIERVKE
jgi:hypothetical protein